MLGVGGETVVETDDGDGEEEGEFVGERWVDSCNCLVLMSTKQRWLVNRE